MKQYSLLMLFSSLFLTAKIPCIHTLVEVLDVQRTVDYIYVVASKPTVDVKSAYQIEKISVLLSSFSRRH